MQMLLQRIEAMKLGAASGGMITTIRTETLPATLKATSLSRPTFVGTLQSQRAVRAISHLEEISKATANSMAKVWQMVIKPVIMVGTGQIRLPFSQGGVSLESFCLIQDINPKDRKITTMAGEVLLSIISALLSPLEEVKALKLV